ncbi:MAG: hypothetical protein LBC25_00400 [Holosporales bacterium]|jgi:hypothetical protein|nr:hypothetical protein [Holosporales bacterium]
MNTQRILTMLLVLMVWTQRGHGAINTVILANCYRRPPNLHYVVIGPIPDELATRVSASPGDVPSLIDATVVEPYRVTHTQYPNFFTDQIVLVNSRYPRVVNSVYVTKECCIDEWARRLGLPEIGSSRFELQTMKTIIKFMKWTTPSPVIQRFPDVRLIKGRTGVFIPPVKITVPHMAALCSG